MRRARAEGYEIALKDIASGKAIEEIQAETFLQKGNTIKNKIFNFFRRNSININTVSTAAVALFIGLTGAVFSYFQYDINKEMVETEKQKREFDLKVSKTSALSELIPSLTSENAQTRGFAYSALFALENDIDELEKIAERSINPADAEIFEDLVKRFEKMNHEPKKSEKNTENVENQPIDLAESHKKHLAELNTKLVELYAKRAENNLQNWSLETDWNKKKSLLKNIKSDVKKAFDKTPDNARAEFVNAILFRDAENDKESAVKRFEKVIELLKDDKNRDDDMYLLSFLNLATLYKFTEDKDLNKHCQKCGRGI